MRFLSVEHTRGNQERLGRAVASGASLSYRDAISRLRPFAAAPTGVRISFEDDDVAKQILNLGYFDDIFKGIRSSTSAQRVELTRQVADALALLEQSDPCLRELVELVVTDVVFMPAERVGGGSGSHLPGIVCVSPGPAWSAAEMAETLVHEAVHLNAFLCEMVNGMYSAPISRLAENDARVLSAVRLGDLRPLDKALHSALVAVPLMYFQELRCETALVDLFTDSLSDCYNGLATKQEFFTEYGWTVVQDLGLFVTTMDYSTVHRGFRVSDETCMAV